MTAVEATTAPTANFMILRGWHPARYQDSGNLPEHHDWGGRAVFPRSRLPTNSLRAACPTEVMANVCMRGEHPHADPSAGS